MVGGGHREDAPRTLDHLDERPPILIYSDGACEGEHFGDTTYGAVLIDPIDGRVEAFGATMGYEMKQLLSENGTKKQLIGQAEILPMVVSRIVWSGLIEGRDVIHYVDNDAARFSCIKGCSPCQGSAWLIQAFWETEVINQTRTWISRVPTECNVGDGPSRDQWEELTALYPDHIRKNWTLQQELSLLRRWGR